MKQIAGFSFSHLRPVPAHSPPRNRSPRAATDTPPAGYDVSAASEYLKTIPRKSGDPVIFTASLDKGPIIGTEDAEIVGVLDNSTYHESALSDWLAKAPRHLLANNFGVPEKAVANFSK